MVTICFSAFGATQLTAFTNVIFLLGGSPDPRTQPPKTGTRGIINMLAN